MFVKDKMTANPYTIRPNASISDAFSIMKDHGFHQLPVVKNGKLVGMLEPLMIIIMGIGIGLVLAAIFPMLYGGMTTVS